jgi:tRNA modification GTPase
MVDTIVALSTPPGRSAIGVVRLSGPQAFEIVRKHIRKSPKNRYALHANFEVDEKLLDDVIVIFYEAPGTYSGEDMVEIFFHGSPLILSTALRALEKSGARFAEKGEFTKRAFLNGKIDLTEAEAVEKLIDSSSLSGIDSARKVMKGNLKRKVEKIREKLLRISAEIEVRIDYPEEFEGEEEYDFELTDILDDLEAMLKTYDPAKEAIDGIKVALFGLTNVGKSSLLNAIVGEDRAIVTPIAGTTRDTVEAEIFVNGLKVRMIDTAGIRKTDDEIEKIGVKRAIDAVENADIKVYVLDATTSQIELPEIEPDLIVLNKTDLMDREVENTIKVSAKTGYGIESLKSKIEEMARSDIEKLDSSDSILIAERQYDTVWQCVQELKEALLVKSKGYSIDLISVNIRKAIENLDLLTGNIYVDDLLDRIFSNFCVGK